MIDQDSSLRLKFLFSLFRRAYLKMYKSIGGVFRVLKLNNAKRFQHPFRTEFEGRTVGWKYWFLFRHWINFCISEVQVQFLVGRISYRHIVWIKEIISSAYKPRSAILVLQLRENWAVYINFTIKFYLSLMPKMKELLLPSYDAHISMYHFDQFGRGGTPDSLAEFLPQARLVGEQEQATPKFEHPLQK